VTMYVPEEGVRRTLQFVGQHPPGSSIAFDFVPRAMVDMIAKIDMNNIPAPARPFVRRFLDLTREEPWVFGIPLGTEGELLGEVGMDIREVMAIGGPDSIARYLTKADGTQVGASVLAAAMARAAAQAQTHAQAQAPKDGAAPETQPQMTPERLREQQRQMAYQLAEAVVRG
jgi:O-methyltransferase involved in polyketide biosynthesis